MSWSLAHSAGSVCVPSAGFRSTPADHLSTQATTQSRIRYTGSGECTACQAALRSNDFTRPPTYDRTMIWSRSSFGTTSGMSRIGGMCSRPSRSNSVGVSRPKTPTAFVPIVMLNSGFGAEERSSDNGKFSQCWISHATVHSARSPYPTPTSLNIGPSPSVTRRAG